MTERDRAPAIAVLSIAGSDSSGGAGIHADLRAFHDHGVYGVSAITAVTAQHDSAVVAIHPVPAAIVAAQIDAARHDVEPAAAKIGMLASQEIVLAVAARLRAHPLPILVIDPVLASSSGTPLLPADAIDSLTAELLPLARCITPNIPEAERLTGRSINSWADAREAARYLHDGGPRAVVITGGHYPGGKSLTAPPTDAIDLVFDGRDFTELRGPRLPVPPLHGSGCLFSAALTAELAHRRSLVDAAGAAKDYVAAILQKRGNRAL